MTFDARDKQLITFLQQDCRISNADLANKTGLSPSACWRKTRALEEGGVIEGYGARVVPQKVGLGFEALVQVKLEKHNPVHLAEFITAVERRAEVIECYATTGQADYQMHVLNKDISAYNVFLEEFLFKLPAVKSAQTNVVLKKIKRSNTIPI